MYATNCLCSAKNMSTINRQTIALQAIRHEDKITDIAAENQVSRDFIYRQKNKAIKGIELAFQSANDSDVLFYLPVTKAWIISFVLCLILHCRASYRGIYKLFADAFDFDISIGTIHNIMQAAAATAKDLNTQQDLSSITIAAHDEVFHKNKPILTGIDIPTLYCHLLSKEDRRDGDTWAINLLDLQKQKFNPTRVIADDGTGLRAGHDFVYRNIPCDADNFHITRDLMDLRRYFRNKSRSAIAFCKAIEAKLQAAIKTEHTKLYEKELSVAAAEEKTMRHLTSTIDTLISWMEHDVLNKPGANIMIRRELFDFVVKELEVLAEIHPHRILPVCVKLHAQRDLLLAFVDVLEEKFTAIAKQYQCPIDIVWQICTLQRCKYLSDNYLIRSESIVLQLGDVFEEIEDAVLAALDSTERTSSAVENLNSRVKSYLYIRKASDQNFLDLLRFYFNHVPFLRSARGYRVNKTPTELLIGKPHNNWLELLGYSKFKRAA